MNNAVMNMKPTVSTITRTVILLLALINQILSVCGINVIPISDETVSDLITVLFTTVSAIVAWWKNNSFTQKALHADEVMKNENY